MGNQLLDHQIFDPFLKHQRADSRSDGTFGGSARIEHFQEYLTQTLRSRLKVAEGVSQAAAGANGEEGSSNARQRLSELWGEIGILQTLFAVRQLNQRKGGV